MNTGSNATYATGNGSRRSSRATVPHRSGGCRCCATRARSHRRRCLRSVRRSRYSRSSATICKESEVWRREPLSAICLRSAGSCAKCALPAPTTCARSTGRTWSATSSVMPGIGAPRPGRRCAGRCVPFSATSIIRNYTLLLWRAACPRSDDGSSRACRPTYPPRRCRRSLTVATGPAPWGGGITPS
jgi:hypothetical protein